MAYRELDTVPAYTRAVWKDDKLVTPDDVLKWGGDVPPPAIGTQIKVRMNNLGWATVTGYFIESNWLGLLCRLHDAPAWHRKQNKCDPIAHIFGPEFTVEG